MFDNKNWLDSALNDINIYEFEEKLPGSKRLIAFKPVTTKTLKKLVQYENTNDTELVENIVDSLISASVITSDFDVNKLYLQDRIFLFFCIRIRSKGSSLEFKDVCEKCKSQYLCNIDFSNIEYDELNTDIDDIIQISDSMSIQMHYITREDQKDIYKYIKENYIENETEDDKNIRLAFLAYAASIKSITYNKLIKENLTLQEKSYFLDNVNEIIFDKIKNWLSSNEFGIKLAYTRKCPHCGNIKTVDIDSNELI